MASKAKSKTRSRAAPRPRARQATQSAGKWSQRVMEKSDAMDLQTGVFKIKSARTIAESLKKSAEASKRRKSSPFRSAMSMLSFEINRAGKNLSAERVRVLNRAKEELRELFGKTA